MSFAYNVKSELCNLGPEGLCCKKAALYGLLLFGRSFGAGGVVLQTEHELVAKTVIGYLKDLYHITPAVRHAEHMEGHEVFIISVEEQNDLSKLMDAFGYDKKTVSYRINRANIENDCCVGAFLRGVFLSCGSVADPGKDYHFEFVSPRFHIGGDLAVLLREQEFEPKTAERKGNHVVYFKGSEQIEDILTLMGAPDRALELMNVKVYKDLRNKANRVTNCETANIEKTVEASAHQVEAIKKIAGYYGINYFPDDLREIAELRLENPEMSLRELQELLGGRLSRSGLDRRLRRITAMAEKIK